MSDQPAPIPEFAREPVKLWRHAGIDCAIYMGFSAPCGYVRLPEAHPLRPVAGAADVVARVFQDDDTDFFRDFVERMPEGRFGHEGLDELLDAPGGLNWGPTQEGWIGFDTGHAFDYWPLDVLRQWLGAEDSEERYRFEYLASRGFHSSQIIEQYRTGHEVEWSLEKLVRVVEHLADQVRALATVKK